MLCYSVSHSGVCPDQHGEFSPYNVGIIVTCVSMGLAFGEVRACV